MSTDFRILPAGRVEQFRQQGSTFVEKLFEERAVPIEVKAGEERRRARVRRARRGHLGVAG